MKLFKFFALATFVFASVSHANQDEITFDKISKDYWGTWLEADPLLAVSKGHSGYETILPVPSRKGREPLIADLKRYQLQLAKINTQNLTTESSLNYAAFEWILENEIERLSSPLTLLSFHTVYSWLDRYVATFKTMDWNSAELSGKYVVHLNTLTDYINDQKTLLNEGLSLGYTQHCGATQKFISNLEARLENKGFSSQLVAGISSKNDSYEKIMESSVKAEKALVDYASFLKNEYAPNCRKADGIWAWENGDEIYQKAAQYYTSTNLTADEIHEIGLSEIKRIRAEVEKIRTSEEVQGMIPTSSLADLLNKMRTDKVFFANSREDILNQANSVLKSVRKGVQNYFDYPDDFPEFHIASIPESIEKDSAAAFYYPNGNNGTLYFNTYKPETRKTFSITSIAIHEGIPGHHYQWFSLKNNTDSPFYRQEYYFHASGEGFALYAESLIDDIYPDVTVMDKLGVLSMELLRAGRLVIDTGIHAKRWTYQQSVDFLMENTGISEHEIEAEVSRFISYPGQATSYKIGQLEIIEMRQNAEKVLGDNFDVKAFHNALVSKSSLPILVLKDEMLKWANTAQASTN